jgi:hypothetical protein
MIRPVTRTVRAVGILLSCVLLASAAGAEPGVLRPQIDGPWWQVAGDPDLGGYTSPKQQPVDFAIWQAADGTWQIWSCIRHTNCGGNTRLFYRWEGGRITDADWQPKGIAMEADPALGETKGGLQAPHVIRWQGKYWMFYGDWQRICLAQSDDGKAFQRVRNDAGDPSLFQGPYGNSRDAMVVQANDRFYCYYTGHTARDSAERFKCAVFCRTSSDLRRWSEAAMVSAGGWAGKQSNWYGGDCECPFVLAKEGRFYLFRNQRYGTDQLNTQYVSPDPLDFGVDNDRHQIGTLPVAAPEIVLHGGQYYIAALMPSLKGIRIARLSFAPAN